MSSSNNEWRKLHTHSEFYYVISNGNNNVIVVEAVFVSKRYKINEYITRGCYDVDFQEWQSWLDITFISKLSRIAFIAWVTLSNRKHILVQCRLRQFWISVRLCVTQLRFVYVLRFIGQNKFCFLFMPVKA